MRVESENPRDSALREPSVPRVSAPNPHPSSRIPHPSDQCTDAITYARVQRLGRRLPHQMELPPLLDDVGVRVARVVAPEAERRRRVTEPQPSHRYLGQPRRERRVHEERVEHRDRLQAEKTLHHQH